MECILPVLLAGGVGSRLWPLSRKSYPKQFSEIFGDHSLFQQTALRLTSSEFIKFEPHLTLTHENFRFIVQDQLNSVGLQSGPILIEPQSKNTAPAVLAASLYAFKKNREAIVLIAPSDHLMPNTESFHKAINEGLESVKEGNIITFGVKPTRAEQGYGYLEVHSDQGKFPAKLKKFTEKPDQKTAEQMVKNKNFMWNAGIFLFKAVDMINAFKVFGKDLLEPVAASLEAGHDDLGFFRLDPDPWSRCDSISIDYQIMEKIKNLMVVPLLSSWSDLGGWDSVWEEMAPDKDGVSTSKNAHALDCNNTLLRSENTNQQIVGLGLNNIAAIAMPDAVLITHKDRAQEVKRVVEHLKEFEVDQAEVFPKEHRPWGWFESLTISHRFQVKKILVHPGAALSLQSHFHRSEHWIVVEGTAKVIIGKNEKLVAEGESVHIPLGTSHRLENPGKLPMVLIEVQTGSYLGEDDILRLEDRYKRP